MKCLICYKSLDEPEIDFHQKCLKSEFGLKQMPEITINDQVLKNFGKELIESNTAITGVQPKLSLWLEESKKTLRFTIIDNKSNYIIKPASEVYKNLPENEDLCMHLAAELNIKTAKHSLLKTTSGALAYITQRFDRVKNKKLASEDLCQLTETLTEHKYRGSYEKTGRTIREFSSQPGLDTINFFELVLLSYCIGNADMHLKNFSMLENLDGSFTMSPAYDLLSTYLVIKNEPEQMSLTINGKKNKIQKSDFDLLAKSLTLNEKQRDNSYKKLYLKKQKLVWWIQNSFLPTEQKIQLQTLLEERISLFETTG